MWGHDNVGKICKVACGGRAICGWQAQFVKVAPDSDLPIVGFSILFNSSRLWTFTLLGIATIRRFQQQRCVHWWELHTSPAIFEVSFQRCDVGTCPSQVNSCHFIIQLQRRKLVCNAYYVYQEMIQGGLGSGPLLVFLSFRLLEYVMAWQEGKTWFTKSCWGW